MFIVLLSHRRCKITPNNLTTYDYRQIGYGLQRQHRDYLGLWSRKFGSEAKQDTRAKKSGCFVFRMEPWQYTISSLWTRRLWWGKPYKEWSAIDQGKNELFYCSITDFYYTKLYVAIQNYMQHSFLLTYATDSFMERWYWFAGGQNLTFNGGFINYSILVSWWKENYLRWKQR